MVVGANNHSPSLLRRIVDTSGEAKKRPQSKKRFVIPGLTRNPESFSPAQRAAKIE
jgi:hypothetical protein